MQQSLAVKKSTTLIPPDYRECSRPFFQLRAQHAPALFGFHDKRSGKPRARSVRDAAEYIFFPEKLAQTLGRPRQLVDNWLPIAIPDGLAHAFGCGASPDAGRALLRKKLAQLCAWLNARLEEAPVVVDHGPSRQVTAFGCVGYNVDFVSRRVSAARIFSNGSRQELSFEIELLQPLATAYWLRWVVEDLKLGANDSQLSLFVSRQEARLHDEWLVNTAYGLLKADPRFEELRKETLPRAFDLNRGFLLLALHARHADWKEGFVPRSTFNLVWQHESLFRRVARENPQLLKLLEVFLWGNHLPLVQDPVAEMRDYFRSCGITEAAWRFVHKHGSRLFRAAWEIAENKSKLAVSVSYLQILQSAGLPPPPAPSLAVAWFRCFIGLRGRLQFRGDWCKAHPTVVRAVLLEGDKRRRGSGFAQFVGEAVGVFHWAMETSLSLNPQQARSGWKWLYRNWRAWRESRKREDELCGLSWQSHLPRRAVGRFEIVPIESGLGLFEEAMAMHNCADTLVRDCVENSVRMFSVRSSSTGRRIATLGIKLYFKTWTEYQVKRAANRPATYELEQLAIIVARLYTQRSRAASGQTVVESNSQAVEEG